MTKRALTLEGQLKKITDRLDDIAVAETIPETGGGLWVPEVWVATKQLGPFYTTDFVADPRFIDGVPTWTAFNAGLNLAEDCLGFRGDPWDPAYRQYSLMEDGLYRKEGAGNWVCMLTKAAAHAAVGGDNLAGSFFGLNGLSCSINHRGWVGVLYTDLDSGAGWNSNIFISEDYGASWTNHSISSGWSVTARAAHSLTVGAYQGTSPYLPGLVMYCMGARAAASTGLWRSLDKGLTWSNVSIGAAHFHCHILVDPNDQSRVFIGMRDGAGPWHVAVSLDHGATIADYDGNASEVLGYQEAYYHISVAMDERQTVRTGAQAFRAHIHMTRNNGAIWDEPTPQFSANQLGISLVQDAPDKLYLLRQASGVVADAWHTIWASENEGREMTPKSGANCNIAGTGGGDSIPFDCAGIVGILQVWTSPTRHPFNSTEHIGTLDDLPGVLADPQTPIAHDILSAYHSDALAAGVSRGSLIYGNATPKWAELTLGAAGLIVVSDGADVAWGTLRAITVNDANPGLIITQAGAGASLSLPSATTAAKGVILGGDVAVFRSAADQLELDAGDKLIVDFGDLGGGGYIRFRNIGNNLDAAIYEANNDVLYIQAGDADEIIFRDDAAANMMVLDTATGQLKLPTVGAGAGLLIGGDAQIYRNGADLTFLDSIVGTFTLQDLGANFIPAHAFYITDGAPSQSVLGPIAWQSMPTWSLDDGGIAASEAIGAQIVVPVTGNIEVKLYYAMESAAAGNVRLVLNYLPLADGEDTNAAGVYAVVVSAVPGTAKFLKVETMIASMAVTAGDLVRLNVIRNGGNAADTAAGDLHFLGLFVQYV